MNKLVIGLLGATILSTPVMAANTAIIMWNSTDPLGAESATGTGSASLATQDLGGITITLSNVTRGTAPNQLTEGNINVDNTTGSVQVLDIIAGANGYIPGAKEFKLTGTVGVTAGMADFTGNYFVDGADTLNGTSLSVVGTSINTFDTGGLTGPFSKSINLTGFDNVGAPYGMAERLTLTLQPGASVFVDGASMTAAGVVPEPRTWVMLLVGFGLMAMGARRKIARLNTV